MADKECLADCVATEIAEAQRAEGPALQSQGSQWEQVGADCMEEKALRERQFLKYPFSLASTTPSLKQI